MNLALQIDDYINKYIISKMKGYLRIACLFSIITFFWATFVEAPKYTDININFSREETNELESKNENRFWYEPLGQELKGERKGKACGCTKSDKANKAINKAIDNQYNKYCNIDYSYGCISGSSYFIKITPSGGEAFLYFLKVGIPWAIVPFGIICAIIPFCVTIIALFLRNLVKGIIEILS